MTFVFRPVLQALVACVPMLIAAISRLVLWRAIAWALRRRDLLQQHDVPTGEGAQLAAPCCPLQTA
ncbi:hypothetical protein [Stenotrophomonas sp. Ste96]|uniref:hypothetical protein n=1 Tax=Stenotrophomonas sp. Ste96 TaxID=2926029 RepID=UPI0021C5F08F|nr:hypothetical protein [Stenotrophomonas sp. Ste96]